MGLVFARYKSTHTISRPLSISVLWLKAPSLRMYVHTPPPVRDLSRRTVMHPVFPLLRQTHCHQATTRWRRWLPPLCFEPGSEVHLACTWGCGYSNEQSQVLWIWGLWSPVVHRHWFGPQPPLLLEKIGGLAVIGDVWKRPPYCSLCWDDSNSPKRKYM